MTAETTGRYLWRGLALTALCLAPEPAEAQPHRLAPGSREEMREFSTDRPDATESPYSVAPGHAQIETGIVSGHISYDGRWQGEELMETNARLGLTTFADLHVVLSTFEESLVANGVHASGMGDTMLRLKLNLCGNDGGEVAIGILPFATLPTGSGGVTVAQTQYGLAIPMAFRLPEGFGLAVMFEADVVSAQSGPYHAELLETMSLGHALIGPLGGFVEITNNIVLGTSLDAQGTFDAGLTLGLDDVVQLDAGFNLRTWGHGSEDVRLFVGATMRQ